MGPSIRCLMRSLIAVRSFFSASFCAATGEAALPPREEHAVAEVAAGAQAGRATPAMMMMSFLDTGSSPRGIDRVRSGLDGRC